MAPARAAVTTLRSPSVPFANSFGNTSTVCAGFPDAIIEFLTRPAVVDNKVVNAAALVEARLWPDSDDGVSVGIDLVRNAAAFVRDVEARASLLKLLDEYDEEHGDLGMITLPDLKSLAFTSHRFESLPFELQDLRCTSLRLREIVDTCFLPAVARAEGLSWTRIASLRGTAKFGSWGQTVCRLSAYSNQCNICNKNDVFCHISPIESVAVCGKCAVSGPDCLAVLTAKDVKRSKAGIGDVGLNAVPHMAVLKDPAMAGVVDRNLRMVTYYSRQGVVAKATSHLLLCASKVPPHLLLEDPAELSAGALLFGAPNEAAGEKLGETITVQFVTHAETIVFRTKKQHDAAWARAKRKRGAVARADGPPAKRRWTCRACGHKWSQHGREAHRRHNKRSCARKRAVRGRR